MTVETCIVIYKNRMASPAHATSERDAEQLNFFRFSLVMLDVLPKPMRELFKARFKQTTGTSWSASEGNRMLGDGRPASWECDFHRGPGVFVRGKSPVQKDQWLVFTNERNQAFQMVKVGTAEKAEKGWNLQLCGAEVRKPANSNRVTACYPAVCRERGKNLHALKIDNHILNKLKGDVGAFDVSALNCFLAGSTLASLLRIPDQFRQQVKAMADLRNKKYAHITNSRMPNSDYETSLQKIKDFIKTMKQKHMVTEEREQDFLNDIEACGSKFGAHTAQDLEILQQSLNAERALMEAEKKAALLKAKAEATANEAAMQAELNVAKAAAAEQAAASKEGRALVVAEKELRAQAEASARRAEEQALRAAGELEQAQEDLRAKQQAMMKAEANTQERLKSLLEELHKVKREGQKYRGVVKHIKRDMGLIGSTSASLSRQDSEGMIEEQKRDSRGAAYYRPHEGTGRRTGSREAGK